MACDVSGNAHVACQLCSGAVSRLFTKGQYHIDQCAECSFAFVNPTPNATLINAFYADESPPSPAEAADLVTDVLARRFASSTPLTLLAAMSGGSLLDVGCGYGFTSATAQSLGFDVVSLEVSPTSRAIAREITGREPLNVSFEDYEGGPFDTLVLSQVLEHARDPNLWLDKAARLLRPGGVVMIALPNFGAPLTKLLGTRDPYVTPPAHLNYFNRANLVAALKKRGFGIVLAVTVATIPQETFHRRLGPVWGKIASAFYRVVYPLIDFWRAGMILRVYAVRL